MPSSTGLTDRLQTTSGRNIRDLPTVRSLARIPLPKPRTAIGSRQGDSDGPYVAMKKGDVCSTMYDLQTR